MLQNVRGGQGQLPAHSQYQETYIPSTSSSSSHQQHSSSTLALQNHRATTYRPHLRRADQVQVVQSVGYRIPKNLQLQDPLLEQYQQVQAPLRQLHQPHQESTGFQFANDALPGLDQLRQLANVHSGQALSQHYQESLDQARSRDFQVSAQKRIDEDRNSRFSTNVHRPREILSSQFTQPQQTSYSRLQRYQGDQRHDTYVRY